MMRKTVFVLALSTLAAVQALAQSPHSDNDARGLDQEVPPAPPGLFHSTLLTPRAGAPDAASSAERGDAAPASSLYPVGPGRAAIARPYWSTGPAAEPKDEPMAPQPMAPQPESPAAEATSEPSPVMMHPAPRAVWPGWRPGWGGPAGYRHGYPPAYGPAPYGYRHPYRPQPPQPSSP